MDKRDGFYILQKNTPTLIQMQVHYNGKSFFLHNQQLTYVRLHTEYPKLPKGSKLMECVVQPGQVLYIPDWWWHATLNIGETVFISTFV
mmetsp:Transcript_25684/g.32750  ORF Transcript_25684/g.32750 Transcript_25684/m.32750 type:complete len:89 (+) Transcript_25684:574-840(+)